MQFNQQQSNALLAIDYWFKNDTKKKQVFRLFGFAGTGKTTIAKYIAANINGRVGFAAYTGKAASVMRKTGCTGASTIHSLVYRAYRDKAGNVKFIWNDDSPIRDMKLIIIDECSMVSDEIGIDLSAFKVPILVLGDPAQLPPPDGEGYFTRDEPDCLLTEIHRQAKDNPIIWLSTKVREGNELKLGTYGKCIVTNKISTDDLLKHDQNIVGRNMTRVKLNHKIRNILNHEGDYPNYMERVISLENDKSIGIFNGGIFEVDSCNEMLSKPNFLKLNLVSLDEERTVTSITHKSSFSDSVSKPNWKLLKGTNSFDYAYAITCHKSQGSQWDSVLIYDESYCFREHRHRWLYTAITRPSSHFTCYKP